MDSQEMRGGVDIRDEQNRHVRQTLHVRPEKRGNGQGGQRRSFNKPATPKGHDAQLKDYQDRSAIIRVIFQSGVSITGVLIARDKFTITLREPNENPAIIYKHALESIKELKPGQIGPIEAA